MPPDSMFSINPYEGLGLIFIMISFAIITSPLALSDSDPYNLKGAIQDIGQTLFPDTLSIKPHQDLTDDGKFLTEIVTPDGKRFPVTVQIKTIPSHLPEDSSYNPNRSRSIS